MIPSGRYSVNKLKPFLPDYGPHMDGTYITKLSLSCNWDKNKYKMDQNGLLKISIN